MNGNDEKLTAGMRFLQGFGRLPGVLKVGSLVYCMLDQKTPFMARGMGLFALIYLIFPIDLIPDVFGLLFGLGFADDAAVIYMAYKTAEQHIKPEHVQKARQFFHINDGS